MMPLDICAAGCITPIGASLAETAASARARLANLRDGPWQDRQGEPHVVGRVPDGVLPGLAEALQAAPISRREAQLLRMGHAALAEVLEALRHVTITACDGAPCIKLEEGLRRWEKNGEYVLVDGAAAGGSEPAGRR